jgi:hypothetical protein
MFTKEQLEVDKYVDELSESEKSTPQISARTNQKSQKSLSDFDMLSFYEAQKMKTKKAKFHDPSLYYRDENKDRSTKLEVVEETNLETGEVIQKFIEQNPLLQKNTVLDKNIKE